MSSKHDDMPPALPSMWRALKRGYEAEPRLLIVSFGLSLLAALPDALLALWLKLARRRRAGAQPRARPRRGGGPGPLDARDVVPAGDQRPRPALFPRPIDHRAGVARRPAPGVGGHHRAPRAARVPQPAGDAARPGVRARSHLHVDVLDVRVDPAAGRDGGAVGLDPPGAGDARGSSRCRRRSPPRGGRAWSAPPRSGRRRRTGWRGTCSRRPRRPRPARRCASRASAIAWRPGAGRSRSAATGRWPRRDGRVPCGTRWPGRSSAPGSSAPWPSRRSSSTRRRATCCWCWRPARDCRRTSPPRWARSGSCGHLARGLEAARLARGLRGRAGRALRCDGAGSPVGRDPLRACLLRLSRHGAPRARGRLPAPGARHGGRDRGRERRRQDHAREAPLPALSADVRPHPRGRTRTGAHARRSVAVAAGRGVPGLLPVRVPGAA